MKPNNVVIVGGGASGLAAGIHLARQGVRVKLFEARDTLGGCCSTSNVDGYTFNNGAMFVAVPRLLDHAFARLGLDRSALLPLRRIATPQASVLPDGTKITLGDRHRVRVDGERGDSRTATLQAEIERCVSKWNPLLKIFIDDLLTQPMSIARVISKAWRHLPKLRGNFADELKRSFSDPQARAALAAVTLYTGLPADRTPVFLIVGLISLLEDGLHLPEGGMGSVSRVLETTFRQLGGEVHTSTPVARIRIEGGRARGLTLENGEDIAADAVISTASGMSTFSRLIEPANVPRAMQRRVQRAPLSHRTLSIQLGLTNSLQPAAHSVNHIPLMDEQQRLLAPQPGRIEWFNYTVPTQPMPELAPSGGSIVEMFTAVDEHLPLDAWSEETKAATADAAIAALARYQPLAIATKRITSPKDYAEGMHLFGGAVYGLSPAARPDQQFPHVTPVDGLYLAGQTTYPGFGVATSVFSGVFAAEALIGQ
ncbi:phytoene desaturase family protein [Paraburkholderia elongata]|uniref:FAD-dependent oxidoreductase n=1 Tax=Paraburkholderia elongata TaxID=2675747 RepID=A0A972SJZ5_9BURK|nr:NAD(P)/FAD-dependent oxidoreductase [Paraburkholderia elongata]NPT58513.1 FAD-dependent oxidoreductase [Paraburkholderia elongata]